MISLQRNLRDAGKRLARARDEEKLALTEIRLLVQCANDMGMSKSTCARLLGVSRQTIYNILNEE